MDVRNKPVNSPLKTDRLLPAFSGRSHSEPAGAAIPAWCQALSLVDRDRGPGQGTAN